MKTDYWAEGYQAGLAGKVYDDSPYDKGEGGTPWAFGCSEGMKDRNRKAIRQIMATISSGHV